MDRMETMARVKKALLCMQRYSWEQGVCAQAFLELGEQDLVIALSKEAVSRQLADGRLGVMGNSAAATDPAAIGEALLYTAKTTGEEYLKTAALKMLDWLLHKAPRSVNGAIYHLHDRPQVWVDSFYMGPPFLAVAGFCREALEQVELYRSLLCHPDQKLFSHIWDDGLAGFVRKDFWGVGNGWALAGMARVARALPDGLEFEKEKQRLLGYIRETVDGCLAYMRPDGLFHDVIDNPASFVETNFSQMLAYVLYCGLSAGWFSAAYREYADKMRRAACHKVDPYGFVQGVCGAPYFDRPGTAAEGQAFFLLMEAAAGRLDDGPVAGRGNDEK